MCSERGNLEDVSGNAEKITHRHYFIVVVAAAGLVTHESYATLHLHPSFSTTMGGINFGTSHTYYFRTHCLVRLLDLLESADCTLSRDLIINTPQA